MADYYEIAVRQFEQQILPPDLPRTTVWSYGSANHPGSFNYPAFTIEARWRRPVRVKWINDLKDPATGDFLPHLLPVDPTLHWANPPGGIAGRDMQPGFTGTPGPYTGPVPIVTHLHGSHATQESDGYAEAWYLPAAANIPAGFATEGSWYDTFKADFLERWGVEWEPGAAVFQYANDQAVGPDEPFGGGEPGIDFPVADAQSTGQVMQFRVVPLAMTDTSTPAHRLRLPRFVDLGPAGKVRQVSLNEEESEEPPEVGPGSPCWVP